MLLLACLLSSILHYTTDDLSDILLLLQQISRCQPSMRIKPATLFIFIPLLFPSGVFFFFSFPKDRLPALLSQFYPVEQAVSSELTILTFCCL